MSEWTYPKIETLFERKDDFTVDTQRLRRPEFALIKYWVLTEKIDGTNVRVIFTRDQDDLRTEDLRVDIRGRSDNAQLPPALLNSLQQRFSGNGNEEVARIMLEHDLDILVLYGEGYGPKIQNGGNYRADQGFILFDVRVGPTAWLAEDQITETADRLKLPRVPVLEATASLREAIFRCEDGFHSIEAHQQTVAEGVVAKTVVPLFDRRGDRVMWKLKTKDFRPGKR